MNHLHKLTVPVLTLILSAFVVPTGVRADDIDIFMGTSAGSSDAPNVIFLIDNSTNWSRASQHWPDNGGNQGQAELAAISATLAALNPVKNPTNVGLAMLTEYAGTSAGGATPGGGGGYIRFGVRDMTKTANLNALQNILNGIAANITDPAEKVAGMANKDESAGFYEIYKYLSGLAPFTGPYDPSGSSYGKQNVFVDAAGNPQSLSGAGQNLTSGFALSGGLYQSPINSGHPCAATYIIYIANNANNIGSIGQAAYQSAVANANPALPVPTNSTDTWLDEWTYFLRTTGVTVPAGNNNGSVVTYVLDAFSAQQNQGYSLALHNAATMGGGGYFQVGSVGDITTALGTIFAEIQAVNSTFASASLPVNTTNRAQDKNQVFIPMFRPDPKARPLWMGNLKQYQLINLSGSIDLGDNSSPPINAVSPLTGFVTPCARSFWTTDSGTYWKSDVFDSPPAEGTCLMPGSTTAYQTPWSDAPDGPIVEKGGAAEVIRKGNNPSVTNTTPTWAVNRTIYTLAGLSSTTPLTLFNSSSLGPTNVSLANFILGYDVNDENANKNYTEVRPSVHGDVIHSRPLPIDYGGTTGVTVYYGSNDGTLRAVDSGSGTERWAFIAPEFYASLTSFSRLMNDSPQISYFGQAPTTPASVPKDYYFDGSIGVYEAANNSKVWIYPSMRRGGRMIYAFDVTDPTNPSVMWKAGCPYPQSSATPTAGCTSGMTGVSGMGDIGQTWSTPVAAANVLGYSGSVVVMGGGYDTCEDANSAAPSCANANGAGVYVLDAANGKVIQSFPTARSVAADVALIAVATAGVVDHAYAVDTGGNIYRLDFASSQSNWVMKKVAFTNGSAYANGAGRKFLFAPALLAAPGGKVYLALGSGDREHPLQSEYPYALTLTKPNRFYVYVDDLATTSATDLDDPSLMDNFTLGPTGQVGTTTSCSTPGVLPGSSMKGWFMDLNQYGQGEQTVTSAIIAAGAAAFSTNRPIPATQGTCSTSLGEARGYWLNLFNASGGIGVPGASCGGTRSSVFIGGGLPPTPVLANVLVGGQSITVTIGTAQLSGSVSTAISPQQVQPNIVPTRKKIFWKSSGEN
jgi:type IV pilus assembly protein PilY1